MWCSMQPNQKIPWDASQVALLRQLWPIRTGWEIAREFYLRSGIDSTKNAMVGKANRLRLPAKRRAR